MYTGRRAIPHFRFIRRAIFATWKAVRRLQIPVLHKQDINFFGAVEILNGSIIYIFSTLQSVSRHRFDAKVLFLKLFRYAKDLYYLLTSRIAPATRAWAADNMVCRKGRATRRGSGVEFYPRAFEVIERVGTPNEWSVQCAGAAV